MKPSIGRIVHYTAWGGCQAAIITAVHPEPADLESVGLTTFPGAVDRHPVPHDEGKSNGSWHWPERVEG